MENAGKTQSLKLAAGLAAVIALAVAVYAWQSGRLIGLDSAPAGTASQKREAPAFQLKDASGKEFSLADAKGSVVVVHFWAAWCPPCLEELPRWLELAKEYEGKPVKFVAVSMDDRWEDAQKVLPQSALSPGVISLLDTTSKVSESFGTFQYPETYLIGKDGRIVTKWVGGQNWKDPSVTGLLDQALGDGAKPASK